METRCSSHDFPEASPVRLVRCALIHHLGDAVGERAVNDVGVTGDPADIRRAPVDVLVAHIEDVFAGGVGAGEVSAGGVEDPFWFSGGAGSIENEERVLGIEALRLVFRGGVFHFLVPPMVALRTSWKCRRCVSPPRIF